jgi:RNA polymerase sigma factor (sigma-70 family)
MEKPNQISSVPERSTEVLRQARDEAIVEWLPLVRLIARSELRRLGGLPGLLAIDLDDLIQSGVLGLIAAIDHFDPALSASKTYFARRIRWAMLDFLRSFPYFKNGVAFKREDQDLLSSEPVTCEEIKRVEARVDLEKLIGPLPDQQRQVILAVMYGVAQHSIASMLKITAGRVSQIKTESFETIRRQLSRRKRRRHETRPALPASSRAAVS